MFRYIIMVILISQTLIFINCDTCDKSCTQPHGLFGATRCEGDELLECKISSSNGGTDEDGCRFRTWERTSRCPYGCSVGACHFCPSNCVNRYCGDDGCGNSCGSCPEGFLCDEFSGTCGKQLCTPSLHLTCGDELTDLSFANTETTNQVQSISCQPDPETIHSRRGPEMAFVFEDPEAVSITVGAPQSYEQGLFLLEPGPAGECDATRCVAYDGYELNAPVEPGKTYYVLVDSYEGQSLDETFNISVECCIPASCSDRECGDDGCGTSCGICPPELLCDADVGVCTEQTCNPALAITCGDQLEALNLNGPTVTDEVKEIGCSNEQWSNLELSFFLESSTEQDLTLRLSSDQYQLFLLRGEKSGLCNAERCLGAASGPEMTYRVEAGKIYYILIESKSDSASDFDLDVECCIPDCSQKTCGSDGCEGICGICESDEICQNGTCVGSG